MADVNVVYGPLCDALGLASRQEITETCHGPLLKTVAWASPASEYRSVQPEQIPVDLDHDHNAVGEVVHLERSKSGTLWAVAHVDDRLRLASWAPERYFSAEVSARRDGSTHRDIELLAVAITLCPTQTGLRPLVELRGEFDHGDAYRRWQLAEPARGLLARANAGHLERRRSKGPIVIYDLAGPKLTRVARSDLWIDPTGEPVGRIRRQAELPERRPPGAIRIRPCGPILSVR